ncbi:MAG: Frataxin protein, partial [Myxococcaceae bacterium]|nr:Frataxin protein [Myxococcaceae bacterium]
DEQRFRHLADETFKRILDGFDAIDADDADVETAGNTIQITFKSGARCVLNTQSAVSQIWLAGGQSGWHFSYDEATRTWLHDKGTGDELFGTLTRLTQSAVGLAPSFG